MTETITLTKATLVNLLDGAFFPNPDDPGPYGPIGPIIHRAVRDFSRALLSNLAPPPTIAGAEADPWRSAFLARAVVDRVVEQYQFAETLADAHADRAIAAVRSQIRAFADDFCGTRPLRWPWPKFDPGQLRPMDLLVAGAQFQKAAFLQNPLQADFSAAAEQLFQAGLERMERRHVQDRG